MTNKNNQSDVWEETRKGDISAWIRYGEKNGYVDYLIEKKLKAKDKHYEEVIRNIVKNDIKKPTHGICCTCQYCGYDYDDCRCERIGERFIEYIKDNNININ